MKPKRPTAQELVDAVSSLQELLTLERERREDAERRLVEVKTIEVSHAEKYKRLESDLRRSLRADMESVAREKQELYEGRCRLRDDRADLEHERREVRISQRELRKQAVELLAKRILDEWMATCAPVNPDGTITLAQVNTDCTIRDSEP